MKFFFQFNLLCKLQEFYRFNQVSLFMHIEHAG